VTRTHPRTCIGEQDTRKRHIIDESQVSNADLDDTQLGPHAHTKPNPPINTPTTYHPNEATTMASAPDIEMSRLNRVRSPAEGSTFTVHGGRSISSAGTRRIGPMDSGGGGGGDMKARMGRFIDSFRRDDGTGSSSNFSFRVTNADAEYRDDEDGAGPGESDLGIAREHDSERYYDLRPPNNKTAGLLARELKGRHLQMIAISGSIGTGLFVASGQALSHGGPASVLLAYLIVGVMLWCTVQALGEMAVVFPVAGSFSAFSTRFLDPSWGFAMGWK
jgi:yeast amino acid transporter